MRRAGAILFLLCAAPAFAQEEPAASQAARKPDFGQSLCLMIESAARANNLPVEFFARVIWQERRFRPNAVGPLTRSGHRAQGIAQFMPHTADERGLLIPLDPVQGSTTSHTPPDVRQVVPPATNVQDELQHAVAVPFTPLPRSHCSAVPSVPATPSVWESPQVDV